MVPACSDLDLWPLIPEANQHICEPKYLYYMTKIGWNFLHWFVTYGVHKVLGSLPAVIFWPNQYFPGPVHTWPNVGKICSNILRAYCIHPIFGSLPAVTLTLWHQNLISTSVNPNIHLHWFSKYSVYKVFGMYKVTHRLTHRQTHPKTECLRHRRFSVMEAQNCW